MTPKQLRQRVEHGERFEVMTRTDLKSLLTDHPLRNSPLSDIGAEYRFEGAKVWREVKPTFAIAGSTFNALGDVWKDGKDWRAE